MSSEAIYIGDPCPACLAGRLLEATEPQRHLVCDCCHDRYHWPADVPVGDLDMRRDLGSTVEGIEGAVRMKNSGGRNGERPVCQINMAIQCKPGESLARVIDAGVRLLRELQE